jgi:hypothetical protein
MDQVWHKLSYIEPGCQEHIWDILTKATLKNKWFYKMTREGPQITTATIHGAVFGSIIA